MAVGQQVRWWQNEEEQSQVLQSERAAERVTPASVPLLPETAVTTAAEPILTLDAEEYHDTWDDLEAEAVRRAEQAKIEETEVLSFFIDKSTALVQHRRAARSMAWGFGSLMLLMVLIPLVVLFLSPHHTHFPPLFGFIGSFIGVFSLYRRRLKWLEENEKPTLRLAPQQLYINTPLYPDISLPWNEIVEIMPKGPGKRRYLEIRASKRRRFVIEGRDLPISADALATRIAIFETGRKTA